MHAHVAMRLVIEGGFLPDDITPHPPLRAEQVGGGYQLVFDRKAEDWKELTIIGGLKSKTVDIVACKEGIGPVVCVSVKGTGNAFRNLTNRMEEAIGDCTNLHVMYPGLVYGFLHLLKGNRSGQAGVRDNDVSVLPDGQVVPAIVRYHDLLRELSGRKFVRNDFTRYEAVALIMVDGAPGSGGTIMPHFPPDDSPLLATRFFDTIYRVYDLRYPYMGLALRQARRVVWDPASPALVQIGEATGQEPETALGYCPRTA